MGRCADFWIMTVAHASMRTQGRRDTRDEQEFRLGDDAAGAQPSHTFTMQVATRWRDMDAYGHINNAVYLTYLEEARDRALSQIFADLPGDIGYVIVRVEVDYRHELTREQGPVTVSTAFTTLGRSSVRTRESLHGADGTLAIEAVAVLAKFDRETRLSAPWSEAERAAFMQVGAIPRT
jgi:acyl-CoA thioester hydrolase